MARTLQQVLAEVNKQSEPNKARILGQIADLPNQQKAEVAGLDAQLTRANDEILAGARRRGLGFSGIPLGEQAEYAATEYAPAVARLKTSYNDRKGTLEGALSDIGSRNYSTAYDMFNSERAFELQQQQFAEQQRQYNDSLAFQREQAAAEARRASQEGSGISPTLGQAGGSASASAKGTDQVQQIAYDDVRTRISQQNDAQLRSDYLATATSAKYGNQRDRYKLQIYRQLRPDLFKHTYGWEK